MMRIKGTAFLARVKLLEQQLGSEDAVNEFLDRHRHKHPEFPASVIPTTLIPAKTFLDLIDGIVGEVFDGDTESLWEIGRSSAEWTLQHGPYKSLLELGDIARFAAMAPVMWSNFFDEGAAHAASTPERISLFLDGVPAGLRHPYFEYSVVGYFERGVELLGARVHRTAVSSFVAGDDRVHYDLWLNRATSAG